jgi:DNA-binding Lrp family transcriptional regulator
MGEGAKKMPLWSCILIRTLHGQIKRVAKAVKKIPDIQIAFTVHGRYDLVVFVNGETHEDVSTIVRKIHKISGIAKTETAIQM